MTHSVRSAVIGALLGLVPVSSSAPGQPVNLALGKPYEMPTPNYSLCADPDDVRQLTDGVRTKGHFWTQKTTVGWSGGRAVTITLDLGQDSPIGAVALSSAGGVADVQWPTGIMVLVSPDGKAWHELGDLVGLAALTKPVPAYGQYATYTYRAEGLDTHGRFVRFLVEPGDQYFFCDEIEVTAGAPELVAKPYASPPIPDAPDLGRMLAFNRLIKAQLGRDLQALRESLHTSALPAEAKQALLAKAESLATRVQALPQQSPEGFRAVLPFNDLEREIFRVQAEVWRAQGKPALRIWQTHRWDPLAPSQEPPPGAPPAALDIVMMQNEVRAGVVNLTNAAAADQTVRLRLDGLNPDAPTGWLSVHEVLHVGTRRFTSVAAALPPATRDGSGWTVTVPSGMTCQVWFSVRSSALPVGDRRGVLLLESADSALARVPFRVRVSTVRFPDRTTLNLGGWSYTNRIGQGGVTAANRDALVATLKEHYVNAPWASAAVLPLGTFDEQGRYTEPPDTAAFDAFVKLWPEARHYMVFLGIGDWGSMTGGFAGSPRGTPLFEMKLAAWTRFWAGHLRELGLKPQQLGLLIVDEPHDQAMYEAILAYTRVINRTEPDLTLWVDPQPGEDQTCLEMLRSMDVIVPHRPQWLQSKDWFPALFAGLRQEGKELGFYSADGPARSFDPYAYYLLQEWHCFKVGGTWAGFWSFGGDSRFSVWNEYAAADRGSYCPMYLDDTGVTAGKWMEAVREGVQDYEYLVMLRQAVAAAKAAGNASRAAAAAALLDGACDRVLAEAQGRTYRWDVPRDRSVADTVRLEILDALSALAPR